MASGHPFSPIFTNLTKLTGVEADGDFRCLDVCSVLGGEQRDLGEDLALVSTAQQPWTAASA